jgi:hypothetical protein
MTPQPPIPVRFVLPRARRRARAPVLGLLVSLGAAACGDVEAIDGPDGGLVDGDDPSLYAAGTTRYEAEARTRQNDAVVATNNPGYTGSGFMDYGGTGSWIEWSNINAAAAGSATVTVRYANGGASERPIALVVNGAAAGTARVPSTGAWDAWTTVSFPVTLRAGANAMRLTATGAAGPNVDHVEVTPAAVAPTGLKLPIEVFGPSGTRVSVQVRVDDLRDITHLYLRCNACGYHVTELDADAGKVKASVRINGGAAIPLKRYTADGRDVGNSRLEILDNAKDYGGLGGVFRTVKLKVPVSGLVVGTNTITFEHVTAAPPSIGFRILELNLLRGGSLSNRVLGGFTQDDPATWTPPLSSATEIAAGRTLWTKRSSLYDPGVDAIDGRLGGGAVTGNITASCADCHASDGRDLAYFNFSNHSIIERSIFHGLSRTDGTRIASYIRSRKADVPVVAAARPWNPTYQPGPGLDARPAYQWAAGAGVDAILADDAAMASYLFPSGQSLDAVRAVVNRHGKLNLRELPVALPMPEWNQWLPHVHPDDAFSTSASAVRADESGDSVGKPFYTALYEAAEDDPTPRKIGDMTSRIKSWLKRGMTCDTNGDTSGDPWRALNGNVLSAVKLPKKTYTRCEDKDDRRRSDEEAYEIAKRGLAAWIAVKQWEIVHSNNLEDEGKEAQSASVPYPGGSRTLRSERVCSSQCVDARERGWFVTGRNTFDRPPHFTGHNSRHFFGQDIVSGVAETNAWYHLNMLLNPGYRIMMPNHFAYVCSHIEILQAESDVDQGFRFWASMIKQRQLQTNGLYGAETGNDLRTSQPHVYYKANRNGTSDTQASVGRTLWRYLAQAMVEDFVADANRATAAEWAAAVNNSKVQARESTDFSTGTTYDTGPLQGRNTFRVIPRLRELGVSSSVLTSLINWGEKTWPRGNWDSLR